MSESVSSKIRIVSLFALIGVIWHHCFCGVAAERWVVSIFCKWAVPWFLCVSGFWFAKTIRKYPMHIVLAKKSASLVVPYVCWVFLGYGVSLVMPFAFIAGVGVLMSDRIVAWVSSVRALSVVSPLTSFVYFAHMPLQMAFLRKVYLPIGGI